MIDALEPEGLFVARVARVEDCVRISDDVHTGRTPAAAANSMPRSVSARISMACRARYSAEPIVSLRARSPSTRRSLRSCVCTGRVSHRFGVSNPAKWAAQRAQLPVARGRTGLGAGPLMNLLDASDQGAHGPHSLQEIVNALKYAAAPDVSVGINQ